MAYKFREMIQPGSNFEFVGRTRLFLTISILAVIFSIAMLPINRVVRGSLLNWTIDFKGGTEIILGFKKPVKSGEVRGALKAAGYDVDVSSFTLQGDEQGFIVRLPEFGALQPKEAGKVADELAARFKDRNVLKASPSVDTFFVRTTQPIREPEFAEFLKSKGLEMKAWSTEQRKEFQTAQEGTGEYNYQLSVFGLDRKVQEALGAKLGEAPDVKQVNAVGAKAGADLRNNAIMSLLYAIALIMLYIAFRFDFRYGPGTVAALLHDAILVVGVFAVTWTEFSLTTVAAVLTVIGYSMNDTIVVFDRIRENEGKYKDKKLDRVINLSVNETLSRTLLTSITTFVVTLAMNLLGTGLVKNFAFAMNIGIVVGTYSSIFVAAPVLLWLNTRYFSKRPATTRGGRLTEATNP